MSAASELLKLAVSEAAWMQHEQTSTYISSCPVLPKVLQMQTA